MNLARPVSATKLAEPFLGVLGDVPTQPPLLPKRLPSWDHA
jgi:hypothetical protein